MTPEYAHGMRRASPEGAFAGARRVRACTDGVPLAARATAARRHRDANAVTGTGGARGMVCHDGGPRRAGAPGGRAPPNAGPGGPSDGRGRPPRGAPGVSPTCLPPPPGRMLSSKRLHPGPGRAGPGGSAPGAGEEALKPADEDLTERRCRTPGDARKGGRWPRPAPRPWSAREGKAPPLWLPGRAPHCAMPACAPERGKRWNSEGN